MGEPQKTTVTDARERKIEIRKLKPLERMRLMELIGPENSKNDRYLGYATLAFCVSSIDGEPLGTPGSKLALEGIVNQLDDDGLDAVAKGVQEHFMTVGPDEGSVKNG